MKLNWRNSKALRSAYFKKYNAKRKKAHRLYMKRYYRAHPEKYTTRVTLDARLRYYQKHRKRLGELRRERIRQNQEAINMAKSGPCTDCHVQYPPYVKDFHHVRGVKRFAISRGGCRSVGSLLAEIAKCDVICANCHRERTHGQP